MIPDSLPVLAVGSHDRGSGYACVMNAVSYMTGETTISDYPSCVDPYLARVAQIYNDTICTHRTHHAVPGARPTEELCSKCSHDVWLFGAELMGTAEAWNRPTLPDSVIATLQWDAWSYLLIDEIGRSPLMRAREPRNCGRVVVDYLMRPDSSAHATHAADVLQVARGAAGLSRMQYDALMAAGQCAGVWNRTLSSFIFAENTGSKRYALDPVRGTHLLDAKRGMTGLASDMVQASLKLALRDPDVVPQRVMREWARRQLEGWKRATGFSPEPAHITAQHVAELRREAALTPVA